MHSITYIFLPSHFSYVITIAVWLLRHISFTYLLTYSERRLLTTIEDVSISYTVHTRPIVTLKDDKMYFNSFHILPRDNLHGPQDLEDIAELTKHFSSTRHPTTNAPHCCDAVTSLIIRTNLIVQLAENHMLYATKCIKLKVTLWVQRTASRQDWNQVRNSVCTRQIFDWYHSCKVAIILVRVQCFKYDLSIFETQSNIYGLQQYIQ